MHRSLTFKLTLAFVAVSLLGILLVAGYTVFVGVREFQRLSYQRALTDLSNFVRGYYANNGTLQGFRPPIQPVAGNGAPPANQPPQGQGLPGDPNVPLVPFGLVDAQGLVILRGDGYPQGSTVSSEVLATGIPIDLNGQVIAYALPPLNPIPYNRTEIEYLQRSTIGLTFGALGAMAIALVLGGLLARTITSPLRQLTQAAHKMSDGDLSQQVHIKSQDEVGELATAFNHMSADLARADQVRRQMTADIAHELRNPLTVITGYIDILRDGDVAATPDRFDILQHEAQHLNRLIDDLRTLSLADVGALTLHRESISTRDLLAHVANTYKDLAEQQQVALVTEAPPALPEIEVDTGRMAQVLGNLVSNALRYTPSGGQVRLAAEAQKDAIILKVQDTGAGIGPDELPFIFERFYRTDKSRQEHKGGSGLGLAIAKAIVEAHQGRIWAESEPGRGTRFTIQLAAA